MGTIGKRLTNPMDLVGLKSVYVENWRRPCAVAFIMSMQFKEVASLINRGIFEYIPAENKKLTFVEIIKYNPCQK